MTVTVDVADVRSVLALVAETVACRSDGEQEALDRLAAAAGDPELAAWVLASRNDEG